MGKREGVSGENIIIYTCTKQLLHHQGFFQEFSDEGGKTRVKGVCSGWGKFGGIVNGRGQLCPSKGGECPP